MNKKKKQKHGVIKSGAAYQPLQFQSIFKAPWIFPALSLLLFILVLSIRKIANVDIGFHLAAGRWITENFAVPHTDTFTYTGSGNRYIDIQWLYQLIMFLTQNVFGYAGLTVLNSLMILCVFYIIFMRMNLAGVPYYISLLLIFAAAAAIQLRFSYRPEIVTWIFLLFVLLVLDRYYYLGIKRLYWLPLIMFFWVNMHGLFIIGLFLIIAYAASIYFHRKKIDVYLLKWSGLSIIAVFVNPYLSDGVFFPFYLYSRLQKGNIFQSTITELQPPWSMTGNLDFDLYLYFILSVITVFLFILTFKKRQFHQGLILAALFYISYSAFRNIPLFVIYAIYISAISIKELLYTEAIFNFLNRLKRYKKILVSSLAVIIVLTCLRVITGAYYWNYNSAIKFGFGVDNTALPENACDYILKSSLHGNAINMVDFGGWIEWRTKLPVFIDGRLEVMSEAFYRDYLEGLKTGGIGYLINKYNPNIIINNIGNYTWNADIKKSPGWRLAFFDNASVVYVKNTVVDTITNEFNGALVKEGINISDYDEGLRSDLINDIRIYSFRDWFKGFYNVQTMPVELVKMANFAFDNSLPVYAEIFYLEFLRQSDGLVTDINYYEVMFNLGIIYYQLNKFTISKLCFNKCLIIRPGDSNASRWIEEINKRMK